MDNKNIKPGPKPEKAPDETPDKYPQEIPDIPQERPDMEPDLNNGSRTELNRNNTQNRGRYEPMGPGVGSNMNIY